MLAQRRRAACDERGALKRFEIIDVLDAENSTTPEAGCRRLAALADADLLVPLAATAALHRADPRSGRQVVLFLKEVWHLIAHSFDFTEQQIMLVVLGLIDVVMISNLLVMVIVGGYETFVRGSI